MVIVGIDPSYSRAGVTVIDTESKRLYIHRFSSPIGAKKGFAESVKASVHLFAQIRDYLLQNNLRPDVLGFETASPLGMVSSAMWVLDAIVCDRLTEFFSIQEVFAFHTSYLMFIHHKRYRKMDSIDLGKNILNQWVNMKYTLYTVVKTRCHDEYESIIFATRLYNRYHENSFFLEYNERIYQEKEVPVYKIKGDC